MTMKERGRRNQEIDQCDRIKILGIKKKKKILGTILEMGPELAALQER